MTRTNTVERSRWHECPSLGLACAWTCHGLFFLTATGRGWLVVT